MMAEDNNFFDDVFGSPEDDPLLEGESDSSDESSSSHSEDQGPPSWVSNGQKNEKPESSADGASDSESASSTPPERKEVIVEGERDDQGLSELNEAVGQGWRLVRISMARPSGQQASSRREAKRFVAVLEQESPQSLFDFGP